MQPADLRPLTLGELLDRTFSLYRANFWLFVGIMAIPSAFSIPFSVAVMSSQGSVLSGRQPSLTETAGLIFFVFVTMILGWIAYSMAIGAATYAVSESYLGHPVTVRGAYGKVRGKFWKIVGVVTVVFLRAIGMFILIEGVGVGVFVAIFAFTFSLGGRGVGVGPRAIFPIILGIGFFLAYLAGICVWLVWSLRYAVSIPALLLERVGVLAAIKRSVQLTAGRRWQLLVAVMLCSMIAYVGVIVFQGPFLAATMFTTRGGQPPPEWLIFASSVFGAVGGSITGSVLMIVLVLCYYDTRIRKEAFDLQFMMSALDQPAPAHDPTRDSGTASPA